MVFSMKFSYNFILRNYQYGFNFLKSKVSIFWKIPSIILQASVRSKKKCSLWIIPNYSNNNSTSQSIQL